MKLIHLKLKFIVAAFGEKTLINDRILLKEMTLRGIIIPPALREEYGGKTAVRINDKEFQRAFKELYFPHVFNPNHYRWTS
jgi:hypothetical protein